jgi:hypothetical protein
MSINWNQGSQESRLTTFELAIRMNCAVWKILKSFWS